MGKQVKVVTKCGEESFYDFDQEVDTVEIVEKSKRHLLEKFREIKDLLKDKKFCRGVLCIGCAFETENGGCAQNHAFTALCKAVGAKEIS